MFGGGFVWFCGLGVLVALWLAGFGFWWLVFLAIFDSSGVGIIQIYGWNCPMGAFGVDWCWCCFSVVREVLVLRELVFGFSVVRYAISCFCGFWMGL